MNPLCYELLDGTLTWNGNPENYNTVVTNYLPVAVELAYVPNPGAPFPNCSGRKVLAPGGGTYTLTNPTGTDYPPGYYEATVVATGALVDVFDASTATPSVTLDATVLSAPNDIGPIPVPTARIVEPPSKAPSGTSSMVVPPDSPRVLVGCGTAPNGNLVLREQYWARQNDSLCLAGNETRTVSYTVTSGMQQTSSDTTTLSASLSSSISGGWGPVSASLSASLSKSSTSFQQVTVSEQTTSYVANEIHNPHDEPIAFLRWQLVDVITVFDMATSQPIASLMQGANPTIVMGPYWVSPKRPLLPEGTSRGNGLFEYKSVSK